jgi:hypothetical protein
MTPFVSVASNSTSLPPFLKWMWSAVGPVSVSVTVQPGFVTTLTNTSVPPEIRSVTIPAAPAAYVAAPPGVGDGGGGVAVAVTVGDGVPPGARVGAGDPGVGVALVPGGVGEAPAAVGDGVRDGVTAGVAGVGGCPLPGVGVETAVAALGAGDGVPGPPVGAGAPCPPSEVGVASTPEPADPDPGSCGGASDVSPDPTVTSASAETAAGGPPTPETSSFRGARLVTALASRSAVDLSAATGDTPEAPLAAAPRTRKAAAPAANRCVSGRDPNQPMSPSRRAP